MEFKVLGPLEVCTERGRLNLGGQKRLHVLAVLLLSNDRMVPVSRLVEAAWHGELPATATHQVRKIIADLRKDLGDELIVTDSAGYRMHVSDGQLDLDLFDLRVARADEAMASGTPENAAIQLDLGMQLWRDSPLCGLGGAVLTPMIAHLEERRLATTERLIDLRLSLGMAAMVVSQLNLLVRRHPLRETLSGQLMLALYRTGRQAEALRVYADARSVLTEELGVDPGPQLSRLHEQILRGDPELELRPVAQPIRVSPAPASQPPVSRPNTLPYSLPDFAGRVAEVAGVVERATATTNHGRLTIVTIDGMAGVGKTSLALHAAYLVADRFPDGQLFIDLRGHVEGREPLDPMDALEQLLHAVGVGGEQVPDDLATRSALWRALMAAKRMLVVLDDAVDIGQIRPLLPGVAGCLLLVTSRARITDLDGGVPISIRPMTDEESVDLLGRIIGEVQVAESATEVRELVEVCGHLPLALRIAAARLKNRPTWTVGDLVRRLRVEDQRLDELVSVNRSVSTAIEMSYRRLPPSARRLFRHLGMMLGTDFGVRAAAAMANLPLAPTNRILEDLLDAQLLIQPRSDRYALHSLLRGYALRAGRAEDTESERHESLQRLLDFVLYTAEVAAAKINPGRRRPPLRVAPPPAARAATLDSQAAALAWFDQEQDTLFAAIAHFANHGPDHHASHLPRAMASYLQVRGRLHNHIDMLRAALAAASRSGDRSIEVLNLNGLSFLQWQMGSLGEVFDNLCRALAITKVSGDREGEGECVNCLGLLSQSMGRYRQALSYLKRALVIHRETGNAYEEGVTLSSFCVVHLALGQYQTAREVGGRALSLHRRLNNGLYVVRTMEMIAAAELGLGNHSDATAMLATTMLTTRSIGYQAGEAMVLIRQADADSRAGRTDDALEHGLQALELLSAIHRPAIEAEALNILGAVHRERGELVEAMSRYRNAAELAERIQYRLELGRALAGIGDVHAELGELAEAMEQWRCALRHHEAMGTPSTRTLRDKLRAEPERQRA